MKTISAIATFSMLGCTGEFPSQPSQLTGAQKHTDLEVLGQSLESINRWHVKNKTHIAHSLRRGLSENELDAELLFGRCALSEELKQIWSWHDGERTQTPFIWYHDFLPLEDAVAARQWLILNPLVEWDPSYIPIFSFEGEWYAAYCGSTTGATGPVFHYDLEDEARAVATNLTTLMAMMADTFESGAVRWVNGAMIDDIGRIKEIHSEHNPGMEFPYRVAP